MSKNKQFGADADINMAKKWCVTLNLQYYVLVKWDWNYPNI